MGCMAANVLNIYDLQNYEFFTNFFSTEKKFVKFVIFYEWKKFVKFEFSIYAWPSLTRTLFRALLKTVLFCTAYEQWRRYTRAHQVKWPGWKIHRPGSALPSPAYCFAAVVRTENKNVTISDRFICFIMTVKLRWRPVFYGRQLKKRSLTFSRKKVHPDDLAGGFSDLEMTRLLYCAGAAIWNTTAEPTWQFRL